MGHGPRTPFENPVVEWVDSRLPLFTMIQKEYGVFPTPRNFNYFWNFGAIAMVMLTLMILTGIFLAMNYTPNTHMAFDSVERIMRDVNSGWLIRYLHMNGASFFFIAVYIHIFRGMYYGSYKRPRELLWILGVIIFLLMMATAFMGYVLPWGQMSYWGATVITNLFSAIPVVGEYIVTLLWGGFSVDNPTLNRFYALHYLLPFVIFAVVFLHIWALHVVGSNNPIGIDVKGEQDTLPFHPYYTIKDTFGTLVFLVIFCGFVFFAPDYLGHPDNYTPANPMVTPPHIVPEWYFLPYYAMLRAITFDLNLVMLGGIAVMFAPFLYTVGVAVFKKMFGNSISFPQLFSDMTPRPVYLAAGFVIFVAGFLLADKIPLLTTGIIPAKLGGVIVMFGSILLWLVMPWLDGHPLRSARYRPVFRICLLNLLAVFALLGYIGSQPADAMLAGIPLSYFGLLFTAYYFGFFLVILPYLSKHEKGRDLPESISSAVLGAK